TTLLHSDWDALLSRTWRMRSSQLGQMESFILEILGLRRLDFSKSTLDSIVVQASEKDMTRLNLAARFIQDILISRHPKALTLQQLTQAIRAHSRFRSLTEHKIRVLVQCAKNIERLGNRYRITDTAMGRRADDYEQI